PSLSQLYSTLAGSLAHSLATCDSFVIFGLMVIILTIKYFLFVTVNTHSQIETMQTLPSNNALPVGSS
ncbi:MAG: hypothetical protein KAQ66_11660, partial [Rhodospirillaceae bacterium]|nr:hypothetical protein [Rhodospirillaceae bacterium]